MEKKQEAQACRPTSSPHRRHSPHRSQSPHRRHSPQRGSAPEEADDFAIDEQEGPEEERPCDAPAVKKRRRARELVETEEFLVQVLAASDAARDESGRLRKGWLKKFIARIVPPTDKVGYQAKYNLARRLRKDANRTSAEQPRHTAQMGRGEAGYADSSVRHSKRKRKRGGGNKSISPALNDELWNWFVDTVQNVKGRIPSEMLLAQAEVLAQDIQQQHAEQMREGTVDTSAAPKIPMIGGSFLKRWRRKYGVTWRTVDLIYKCSLLKQKNVYLTICCVSLVIIVYN